MGHVRHHARLPGVDDLVVNSRLDPETDEVAAFEELVGCHGGLGGWQTRAALVHPAAWPRQVEPLVGAHAVHRQLVAWPEKFGDRTAVPVGQARAGQADVPRPGPEPVR